MVSAALGACCCLFLVGSLVVLIVVPQSFGYVPPNKCGILRSSTSKMVYPEKGIFESGRYWIGMTGTFFMFPKTVQVSEEKLDNVRTSEGYKVVIQFSFMYQLVCDDILTIYKNGVNGKPVTYELDYDQNLRQRVKESLRSVISKRPTQAFWEQTEEVVSDLRKQTCDVIKNIYAECFDFQLISYTVDNRLENLIQKEIGAVWSEKIEIAKRDISKVNTDGKVIESDWSRKIKEVNAEADVQVKVIDQEAMAAANLARKSTAANASLIRRRADGDALVIERTSMLERTRLVSEAEANATVKLESAKSTAENMILAAEGRARERLVAAQGLALQYLKDTLGLSNAALGRYQEILVMPTVYSTGGRKLNFGFGPGIISTEI